MSESEYLTPWFREFEAKCSFSAKPKWMFQLPGLHGKPEFLLLSVQIG
jgi:hypothetical protein